MSIRNRESRPGSATGTSATGGKCGSPAAPVRSSIGEPMSTTRLQELYRTTVHPALMTEFGYENPMQVPRLEKIVVNMGVGEAVQDSKKADAAASDLTAITGQHPVITKAKRSIATFKLRKDMPIGCKVTLRGQRMYEFLDRLITVALPRVRDFRGISGMNFVVVTTARTDAEAKALLKGFDMPFAK